MATDITTDRKFWEFKKYKEHEWFKALIILLLSLVFIYIAVHFFVDKRSKSNFEYAKLDELQMQQIVKIYFDSTSLNALKHFNGNAGLQDTNGAAKKAATVNNNNQPATDSLNDSTTNNADTTGKNKAPAFKDSFALYDKALYYISNEFSGKIDAAQIDSIRNYLKMASPIEATSFFGNVRLKVKSNFWLVGPAVYWEIVFWSWFGVICSLLFNLGVVSKNSTTNDDNPQTVFDSSEIPSQIGKLLYAPMCTLVIVFGYNFFKDQNIVDISSSKGVIVFAFIGGFYSSRLIAFLDRLKEVLLPTSSNAIVGNARQNPAMPELENVKIQLQLDESITGDLRNEITELGFNDAVVTLENEQTKEIITASAPAEDQSALFVVPKIKQGKYTVKVTWSKEVLNEVVNLTAEQLIDLKTVDEPATVLLTKSENSG